MQRPQDRERRERGQARRAPPAPRRRRAARRARRRRARPPRAAPTARITAISTSVEEPSCRPPLPTNAIAASAPASVTQIASAGVPAQAARRDGGAAAGGRHLAGPSGGSVRFHASPPRRSARAARRRAASGRAATGRAQAGAGRATSTISTNRAAGRVPKPARVERLRRCRPGARPRRRSARSRREPAAFAISLLLVAGRRRGGVDALGAPRLARRGGACRRRSRAARGGSPSGSRCTRRGRRAAARAPRRARTASTCRSGRRPRCSRGSRSSGSPGAGAASTATSSTSEQGGKGDRVLFARRASRVSGGCRYGVAPVTNPRRTARDAGRQVAQPSDGTRRIDFLRPAQRLKRPVALHDLERRLALQVGLARQKLRNFRDRGAAVVADAGRAGLVPDRRRVDHAQAPAALAARAPPQWASSPQPIRSGGNGSSSAGHATSGTRSPGRSRPGGCGARASSARAA